ncbi:formate dehydrogenase formation domain protein [Escherichia coli 2-177-06_S3_C2]|nr:formate dehydrogenase formation domain protein [Escherichia coli 2-177-06_S3_C2]KEO04523.1 formate dehydrogenase formation domain protein [Escherichia coli 2-177-06_S3_C3]
MQYAKPVTLNVEECDRLFFLPYLFGQDFLYVEASVCALAKKMMPVRIPLYSITDWHRSPISDSHPFDQPGT